VPFGRSTANAYAAPFFAPALSKLEDVIVPAFGTLST
jgi:hypothetical protein